MQSYCPWCARPVTLGQSCSKAALSDREEPDFHRKTSVQPCPYCGKLSGSYTPASYQLPAGSQLQSRYVAGRVLGSGGFTITYLGWDTVLERQVVIKEYFPFAFVQRDSSVSLHVIRQSLPGQSEACDSGLSNFVNAARAWSRFNFDGSAQVLNFFEENNTAYIIMDYLEGRLLSETGKYTNLSALLNQMEPIVHSIETVHRAGLLYRDISPDNIMCLEDGSMRLIRTACPQEGASAHAMTVMLKQGYAPIEQYSQLNQGPWTDVYALCAVIYDCLTGQPPPLAVLRDGSKDPLQPPSQLGAALSPDQEYVLLKGLAVHPQKRWQSVTELWDALVSTQTTVDLTDAEVERSFPTARAAPPRNPAVQSIQSQQTAPPSGSSGGQPRRKEAPEPLSYNAAPSPSVLRSPSKAKRGNGKWLVLLVILAVIAAVVAGAFFLLSMRDTEPSAVGSSSVEISSAVSVPSASGTASTSSPAPSAAPSASVTSSGSSSLEPEKADSKSIEMGEVPDEGNALTQTQTVPDEVAIDGELISVDVLELDLSDRQLTEEDMENLSRLTSLQTLNLAHCKMSDLSPLRTLDSLTELNLSGNQIEDVSPLESLVNLQTLNLNGNQISDLSPLSRRMNLTNLLLSDNQIEDISPMSRLVNLTELNLDNNQIQDVSSLERLSNLTALHLGGNGLEQEQIDDLQSAIPDCSITY